MPEEITERESLRPFLNKRIFLLKKAIPALQDLDDQPTMIPPDAYSITFGGSRFDKNESYVFMETPVKAWVVKIEAFMHYLTDGKTIHLLDKQIGQKTAMQAAGRFMEPDNNPLRLKKKKIT